MSLNNFSKIVYFHVHKDETIYKRDYSLSANQSPYIIHRAIYLFFLGITCYCISIGQFVYFYWYSKHMYNSCKYNLVEKYIICSQRLSSLLPKLIHWCWFNLAILPIISYVSLLFFFLTCIYFSLSFNQNRSYYQPSTVRQTHTP